MSGKKTVAAGAYSLGAHAERQAKQSLVAKPVKPKIQILGRRSGRAKHPEEN